MSEAATPTTPTITIRDVEDWCANAQMRDGRKILQSGAVLRPWAAGASIHAEVQGSGSTPYRIDITFKNSATRPSTKCSCPAWRSNPLCKHVAAVLLAWATKPETFTVMEAPPVEVKAKPARTPKKAASEASGAGADTGITSKSDAAAEAARTAQLEGGLSQATDLLTELCARGLLAATSEQADAVLKLAELLISQRLNALGRRVQMLAIRLRQVSDARTNRHSGHSTISETDFAALLADAWLTLAATRRALHANSTTSEASADLEDLLGTRFDESRLSKAQSAALLEVAFEEVSDELGYVTDTSYLLDLESGEVLLDQKIIPQRLVERERKRPYNALLLNCQIASSRSQPPRRVKVSAIGQKQPISADALARAARHALTTVAVLRRRLAAQIADPLASRELLALFAPQALQAIDQTAQRKAGPRLLLADAEGVALPIERATSVVLGLATQESILALFGRLRLNERGEAFVFAPLSVLCASGKLQMLS